MTSTPAPLVAELRRAVAGEVDAGRRRRAEYASDASNYRVVPRVVVFPRDADDLVATAAVCRAHDTPLTVRGGGTSVAGNAVGPGVVVDCSRHLDGVLAVDPEARTARVQPGVVLDDLQAAVRGHGLRFGPDPSTHGRCTLGGMIGNNACGAHTVAYGTTADNVLALDVLDGTGARRRLARDPGVVPGLADLVDRHGEAIRRELGTFGRQVSGYALEHLLPERGGDVARAFVGTEGTCGVVLGATVRLVEAAPATALAVLGYPDMATAADAAPGLLDLGPLAVEGIDARLVDVVRAHRGPDVVAGLPPGGGWLLVEAGGETPDAALAAARRIADASGTTDVVVEAAGERAAALWRIREDGAGLAGRTAAGDPAWPAWEDAAVPPAHLGDYLRDFSALLDGHGLHGVAYGHFGDGCVHVRLDLPLATDPGRLRPFLFDAADLVAAHGGSLSGEHGDGRARSELLPRMYGPDVIAAFAEMKRCFDPDDRLNPGVVVDPAPVDADLRRPGAPVVVPLGGFALSADGGDFSAAVHRCVGLGKCRADTTADGGFMCPSYLATGDEKDVTRGRARVLQDMARFGGLGSPPGSGTGAEPVSGGWSDAAVHESLDLCLSCKACARDCPAGVDMATYKSQVLHQTHRGRIRPRAHYALGQLPRWARLAGRAPRLVNALLGNPVLRRLALRAAGVDNRRHAPRFAAPPLDGRGEDLRRAGAVVIHGDGADGAAGTARPPVLLWADSFTSAFDPDVAVAATELLTAAGYEVRLPAEPACCGLTWITTGQLDGARRQLGRLLGLLAPAAGAGVPVVALEPSCAAVLRGDLTELLPDDPRSATLAGATRTLAEALADAPDPAWAPPRLDGVEVVVQPHCHQHAVLGFSADRALLERTGATVRELSGCCGLAGNFGMERGHYEVSVAVARHRLLPALEAAPGAVLLADGFSCRTQADQLAGRRGIHLAQLLAGGPPA